MTTMTEKITQELLDAADQGTSMTMLPLPAPVLRWWHGACGSGNPPMANHGVDGRATDMAIHVVIHRAIQERSGHGKGC